MKKRIQFAVLFFILLTLWKWFASSEIYWLENVMITIGVTLVAAFVDWANIPHEYKKRR